ncbi:helix-turn-helix transcriptional regulator [Streptomyces aidingensis]|uniref:Helix-turn-helix domain-containing protein n=1 Tax=Streptomyces aidingensis TaxID=910347 RepID=A0A1I1NWK7_9ACTN|nr:helix-turn-helix transcriptional regulator [Streptomyces aidingensis]SFC98100.1 Helix-turn-helix domain-containing protein [Streptomyces aidingensis]
MDRAALADFLRRSRARLNPAEAGPALPATGGRRRRTPGLRREEASALAGISVDYWIRLEQARGPRPSPQVLSALARALRLRPDERDHLFRLAGQAPPPRPAPPETVAPGPALVLAQLTDLPGVILTDYGQVLAQNALSVALGGDLLAGPPGFGRNLVHRFFTRPPAREILPAEDRPRHAAAMAAELRAVCAARPDDPRPAALVRELLAVSEEFAALWREHRVGVRRGDRKRFRHPAAGLLELDCETLLAPDGEQRLVIHSARPGTDSHRRLRALAAAAAEAGAAAAAGAGAGAG